MKILLLTTFPINTTPFILNNCRDPFQTFSYFLYQYLGHIADVEIMTVFIKGKTNKFNTHVQKIIYPYVNHTILIDDKGFYSRGKDFLLNIRKYTSGLVCSIASTSNYYGGEDIMYYIDSRSLKCPNTICIKYPINDTKKNKVLNEINILTEQDDTIFNDIMAFAQKSKEYITFNIYSIQFLHGNYLITDTKNDKQNLLTYGQFIKKLNKYHYYFATFTKPDIHLLYQLHLNNITIVSKNELMLFERKKQFSVIGHNKDIPWKTVIETLNIYKKEYNKEMYNEWSDIVMQIYNNLYEHYMTNIDTSTKEEPTYQKDIEKKETRITQVFNNNNKIDRSTKNKNLILQHGMNNKKKRYYSVKH